jgi:multiple sugar transport system ATP-binding protein
MNFLPGKLSRSGPSRFVTLRDGAQFAVPGVAAGDGMEVVLGVRPEHLTLSESGAAAQVVVVEPTGADTQVYCKLAQIEVTVVSRERHNFRPGDSIRLQPLAGKTYLFDPATGRRLA